ncbi:hypothetical protein [Catenulispora sp. EB89]|uniref:hypothetical protein n=1 Tax=Catenulispora sp. EB89 TaxID=3156257 RepID=UPI0035183E05
MAASPTAGEPSKSASSFGFAVTFAILVTALASTLGLQLVTKLQPSWTGSTGQAYRAIWPQGWSFFDNYADSATLSVFGIGSDMKEPSPLIPRQMSSRNLWGLADSSQTRAAEANYVKSIIPAGSWYLCADPETARCFSSTAPLSLVNQTKPASLCGLVAFVLTWPETNSGARRPSEVAMINLICSP